MNKQEITDEMILHDINNAIICLIEKLERPITYDEAEKIGNSLEIVASAHLAVPALC